MKDQRTPRAAPSPGPAIPPSLAALLQRFVGMPGALLPLLHAVQAEHGHIDDSFVPAIADALNLSRAEVHGTLTFYHDFRRKPAASHVVKLCGAEACQARGGTALAAHAKVRLAGADVTLETVYCLGLCSVAPAAMIDGRVHARLDASRLDSLLEAAL